jgi:HSP20 family molecular chaperone IbpA
MIVIRRGRARDRSRRSTETEEILRGLVFGGGSLTSGHRGVWRPLIEVYETDEALEIVAELAGMDREQIEVLIEGDIISLRGVRPDPAICERRSYHEARIPYGHFAADIYVPFKVDGNAATAIYENGFLRVSLPREREMEREQSRTLVPKQVSNGQGNPTN